MNRSFFIFLAMALCLASCDKNRVFDQYKSLPGHWNKDSTLTFKVNGLDSLQAYDLFINIRNTNAYRFSNIYLITHMDFPNGKVVKDTLEYMMAYPNGEWMGTGIGETKTSKLSYKNKVYFREKGTYTFTVRQAMRKIGEVDGIQDLDGVTDVGLRIEKANQTKSDGSD